MFAIKYKPTGELLGVSTYSNYPSEFCAAVEHILEKDAHNVWVVASRLDAENARKKDVPWYDAGYFTPGNQYDPEDLEVVELTIKE
jgi:hypothetical protein